MIEEAKAHGLKINVVMRNHLARGHPRSGGRKVYVKPDPAGKLHNSLTWQWRPLEWIPKSMKWQEWQRWHLLGYYIPDGEPRKIEDPIQTPIWPMRRSRSGDECSSSARNSAAWQSRTPA
jgi:hypothetical protein